MVFPLNAHEFQFVFFPLVFSGQGFAVLHPRLLLVNNQTQLVRGWWCKCACGSAFPPKRADFLGHRYFAIALGYLTFCVDMWYPPCLGPRPLAPCQKSFSPKPWVLVCQCWVIGLDYFSPFLFPCTCRGLLWIHFCGCRSCCRGWLIDWLMDGMAWSCGIVNMLLRPSSFCPKFILNFFLMAPKKKIYTKARYMYVLVVFRIFIAFLQRCFQTIIIFCIISARLLNSHKNSCGMRAFFPRTPPSIPAEFSHPTFSYFPHPTLSLA